MQVVGTSASGFVYSDTGGDGPAVVLLHGVLMAGSACLSRPLTRVAVGGA